MSLFPPCSIDQLLVIGLNHRMAPVELREKLAFPPDRLVSALQDMRQTLSCPSGEIGLLSTCNRTEIYTFTDNPSEARARLIAFLSEHARLTVPYLEPVCYSMNGRPAALHLLNVAAGLDSLVIGEQEILGQVKRAFGAAQTAGTCGSALSALFRAAIQTGKRVRSETEIGRTGLSIAAIVVEQAQLVLGPLEKRTALLIGAGKISSMTARALTAAGLSCILVANRTFERAQKLARSLSGRAVHFGQLPHFLPEADIVICSTGAPHTVLHTAEVRQAMAARPERPIFIADLAVPRDADPEISTIPGVCLYDIDDLDQLVQTNHPLAAKTRRRAEAIVVQELECFESWVKNRSSAGLICALNQHASSIVQAQVQKTTHKLGDLTPRQQQAIEKMGQAIASQLLHEPIVRLKRAQTNPEREPLESLVGELFGIDSQDGSIS